MVESIEAQNDIELPIVVKKLIDLSIVVEPVEANKEQALFSLKGNIYITHYTDITEISTFVNKHKEIQIWN